jgi:hypothetical protein
MFRLVSWLFPLCVACGSVTQPESARTIAAFEVPLPTKADKIEFVAMLKTVSAPFGYHVDAASDADLLRLSEVSPITMSAAVWWGNDDEEAVASAMDLSDNIGRVWLSFSKGEDPRRVEMFRNALLPQIKRRWPNTMSLPIMPSGVIPLPDDLVLTSTGYQVRPSAESKYQLQVQ